LSLLISYFTENLKENKESEKNLSENCEKQHRNKKFIQDKKRKKN